MKVADLLESRRANWAELERLCQMMEKRSYRKKNPQLISSFSSLYRAACADLALADAYQLPAATVRYLHQLVGQAHNQLYRSRRFNFSTWTRQLFFDVPQQLFSDKYLRLAFCVFWGVFLLSSILARSSPGFVHWVVPQTMKMQLEESFSKPLNGRSADAATISAAWYISHNTGIGLQCFAGGLLLGVGGIFITVSNATTLGAVFGFMSTSPHKDNFFHFVTAHGPFELTAIVLSAAAGMRLGFSLVDTHGFTRIAALRRATKMAMPTMGAAMIMFLLAALIEGFLSPSVAPYWVKALVAVVSSGLLMFYLIVLGYPQGDRNRGTI